MTTEPNSATAPAAMNAMPAMPAMIAPYPPVQMRAIWSRAPAMTPEQAARNAALDTLGRSERGHRALVRFRAFLLDADGDACGLDTDNWRALETLVRTCRTHGPFNMSKILPKE